MVNGRTLIRGGYINTDVIEVNELFSQTVNATNMTVTGNSSIGNGIEVNQRTVQAVGGSFNTEQIINLTRFCMQYGKGFSSYTLTLGDGTTVNCNYIKVEPIGDPFTYDGNVYYTPYTITIENIQKGVVTPYMVGRYNVSNQMDSSGYVDENNVNWVGALTYTAIKRITFNRYTATDVLFNIPDFDPLIEGQLYKDNKGFVHVSTGEIIEEE